MEEQTPASVTPESLEESFPYGGQAVLEGVMIRGRRFMGLAVRRPTGDLYTHTQLLPTFSTGSIRRIPLLRGVLVLAETLVLGSRALNRSAAIATAEAGSDGTLEEPPKWMFVISMFIALAFGIALFFLTPLYASKLVEKSSGHFIANLTEGLIRLVLLVGYIWLIGQMKDIRRVFEYHGAEHMTIHAREHGEPLDYEHIRKYPKEHPRCGTAFLLTVVLLSIVVFTIVGRHGVLIDTVLRIAFVPLIASLAYEGIRFSGFHQKNFIVRALTVPNLWLQYITTRKPDDAQIDVAIAAVRVTIAADRGA